MAYPILGLHHVTATVDEAQPDLAFCLGALGLRLVKRTVNFDNHHVHHFYYGDDRGTPGTIWTTFPYFGHGVRVGIHGAGQITCTSFSIPPGSIAFWEARLRGRGVTVVRGASRFGEETLACGDTSGLAFELVAGADRREPWLGAGIDAAAAIRGLHSVTMAIRDPEPTVALMRELLGFDVAGEQGGRIRLAVNGNEPGQWIEIAPAAPDAPNAVNGTGTVHHVAMAIERADDQLKLRDALIARGLKVTDVRDRCYFQSIYFREPGAVLFEVATIAPGFLVDEPADTLGRALKLPPWEEEHRADIEAHLAPLTVPAP
jgi:glyoxalase family protein